MKNPPQRKHTPWIAPAIAVAALLAALVGGLGYRVHAQDRAALDTLRARVDSLAEELAQGAHASAPQPSHDLALDELSTRMSRLESGLERTSLAQADAPPAADPVPEHETETVDDPPDRITVERAEMAHLIRTLIDSNYDYGGLSEELERFYAIAKETGVIDDAIAELEAHVADNPSDSEAHMELADWYIARLMTVSGPEQGRWGAKAEQQWKDVVALDDGHWRANFALGQNYSYYPEVMGKTDEAIGYLERAREAQRNLTPAAQHVQTYLMLARLYVRQGKPDAARAVLEEGLATHPANEELAQELEQVEG